MNRLWSTASPPTAILTHDMNYGSTPTATQCYPTHHTMRLVGWNAKALVVTLWLYSDPRGEGSIDNRYPYGRCNRLSITVNSGPADLCSGDLKLPLKRVLRKVKKMFPELLSTHSSVRRKRDDLSLTHTDIRSMQLGLPLLRQTRMNSGKIRFRDHRHRHHYY